MLQRLKTISVKPAHLQHLLPQRLPHLLVPALPLKIIISIQYLWRPRKAQILLLLNHRGLLAAALVFGIGGRLLLLLGCSSAIRGGDDLEEGFLWGRLMVDGAIVNKFGNSSKPP